MDRSGGLKPPNSRGGRRTNLERFALFVSVVVIVLTMPQLWEMSWVLTSTVLESQIGPEMTTYAFFVVFLAVVGAAFFASQLGLASSITSIGVLLLLKLPIF